MVVPNLYRVHEGLEVSMDITCARIYKDDFHDLRYLYSYFPSGDPCTRNNTTYPAIEVVYSASQQTLYVSTVGCEIGKDLRRHVAENLAGRLNGFDCHLLFSYTTMTNPFIVRSCVVPPSDLTVLRYSERSDVSTMVYGGREFFESGYLSHYKQLMTKIKLHASNDESNLPITIFVTLVDELPKFEIPEIDFVEELNHDAQMQQFTDTLLSYRRSLYYGSC
ncbi:hypothetical protein V1525DRAFT_433832 [Lipomyces kononenkoae]|uniref:Uncharacterized protein n=1 Tax=Lipomyces kononenkoae TaxID=34357 RepID=A0ACC3SXG0_LIPKO